MGTNSVILIKKISHLVLRECYADLKRNLPEEVIDHLWTQNRITDEDKIETESNSNPITRKKKLIDILSTK